MLKPLTRMQKLIAYGSLVFIAVWAAWLLYFAWALAMGRSG